MTLRPNTHEANYAHEKETERKSWYVPVCLTGDTHCNFHVARISEDGPSVR
jgi:hypothetical protein